MKKAHYIREWRKHRGFTMERLAEQIGTSKAVISRIENGLQRYNQEILEAMSKVMSVTPADLIAKDPLAPDFIAAIAGLKPEQRAVIEVVVQGFVKLDGDPATLVESHDIEAEQSLIGALIYSLDKRAMKVAEHILGGYFYEPAHEAIWNVMSDLAEKGEIFDPVYIADQLADDDAFQALGGVRYLAELVDRSPPVFTIGDCLGRIVSCWYDREFRRLRQAEASKPVQ